MARYVEGFVTPIKKSKVDEYKKLARKFGKLVREHGAEEYNEFLADDVPYGKTTSFPRAVERKNSETVVLAWITYKSKAQRDKVNEKLMADPRMGKMMSDAAGDGIFDPSRMIYGGFEQLVRV